MTDQNVRVTRYVRAVVDGKIVVRRPGDWVDTELAVRLGLHVPGLPPLWRARRGAFLPAVWS